MEDGTDSSEAELEQIFEKVQRAEGGGAVGGPPSGGDPHSSSSDVDNPACSTRMINSAFNDVIIDPVPSAAAAAGPASAFTLTSSRKNSAGPAAQGEWDTLFFSDNL